MKTVVITGGAGGIGREFSRLFAKDGYRVVVFDLLAEELDALAEELRHTSPGAEVLLHPIDLAQHDAAEKVVAWCDSRSLEIDVLVNNVGFGLLGEHVRLDPVRVEQMLLLNNMLLTKLTLLVGRQMQERRRGHILIVSSMVGFSPAPFFAAYSGTKAYALAFSVAVARELEDYGVSVSCLCPGTTRTRFLDTAQTSIESAKGITRFVSAYTVTPDVVAGRGLPRAVCGQTHHRSQCFSADPSRVSEMPAHEARVLVRAPPDPLSNGSANDQAHDISKRP
jgi:short-subunit dehydrogenase